MAQNFVRTGPCPQCSSFKTMATLRNDGTVLLRQCMQCDYIWDRSPACRAVERMTKEDLDALLERERAEDQRLGR